MDCTLSGPRLITILMLISPSISSLHHKPIQGRSLLQSLGTVLGSHLSPLLHQRRLNPTFHSNTKEEECYNSRLLPHASRISLHKPRKKCATLLDYRVQDAPSFSYLKLLLTSGFFTFLTAQQASDAAAAATLQSYPFLGDAEDISTGFASVFLLIFFSELGDKTFFIAALLAARNSAAVTFIGTFGALAVMTVISVVLGRTFHYVDDILPFSLPAGEGLLSLHSFSSSFTHKPTCIDFKVYFGVSSLVDADGVKAEEEQKEAELAVSELSGSGAGILSAATTVFSTFALVFVAEWGDKSFFFTIALAAASSPLGVIAGHGVASLLAVLGGSFLGTYLSEKAIAYIGGTLFLVFAAVTLVEIVVK